MCREVATKRTLYDRLFSAAVLLPFAAATTYLHYRKGVAYDSFIFGSGSWGFGCILKLAAYHLLIRRLRHDSTSILGVSALNGLVSGVKELGLALAFFAFLPVLSLWDVVAFGIGIGTIEAFLVATSSNPLKGTALEKLAVELEATIRKCYRPDAAIFPTTSRGRCLSAPPFPFFSILPEWRCQ